ncbi:MAG: M48 family metallopeptidase [Verrucomicrobia bacterium]|nr:M48 family metallopeptidase [Verrucomicrobiota bacterium]
MDLDYRIVRSPRRKQLTITVERDRSVVVHAPLTATDEAIRRIVDTKRQWLFGKTTHSQKYQSLPHAPGKEVVNGESVSYLGRDYPIEIAETESGGVEFSRRFLVPAAQQVKRREVLRDWYVSRATETILPRVRRYAADLGVEYGEARIVDNRYRWGSCTVKDNVHFNWRLIKAPMFVIDYIIVHELAHLMETNHTPRFWNIVRAKVPHTEKARTWLKEHGQILEEDV